jgi:hypothetical protein
MLLAPNPITAKTPRRVRLQIIEGTTGICTAHTKHHVNMICSDIERMKSPASMVAYLAHSGLYDLSLFGIKKKGLAFSSRVS